MIGKNDSIVRYCKKRWVEEDGSISPAAFFLRENEVYLSVHHFEHFKNNQYQEIKDVMNFNYKDGDKFIKINYSKAEKKIKDFLQLQIELKKLNASHCGIFNLTPKPNDEKAAPFFCDAIDEIVDIP